MDEKKEVNGNKIEQPKYYNFNPGKYSIETQKNITVICAPPKGEKDKRILSDVMTKAEYTEVTSIRADQISKGGIVFVMHDGEDDPIKLAEKEVAEKQCPLKIRRGLNNELFEDWSVNELAIPHG